MFVEDVRRFFAHGAVDHTCLTEAATADTAAIDLKHDAVVNRFNVGHDHLFWEIDLVKILDDLLGNFFGDVVKYRCVGFDRAVVVVGDVIQRRNVHAGYGTSGFAQESRTRVAAGLLHLDIETDDRGEHILALTNVEQIEKVRDRLGVVGTRTAADDQGRVLAAILGTERNLGKLQHFEHVGVAHFVLERKGNEIKCGKRIAAFQRGQGQVMLFHFLLHIHPRGVGALAPNIGMLVECPIEQAHAEIGHADLVGVGEAEGKASLDVGFILDDLTVFSARISARL